MPWVPNSDFEYEIVDLQQDYDFIYAHLQDDAEAAPPRPAHHLAQINELSSEEESSDATKHSTLKLIGKVQEITKSKPLGHLPCLDDWNNNNDVERETVAMMRHCRLAPANDAALDINETIATHPVEKDYVVTHDGHFSMPVFFNEKYFQLHSKSPATRDAADIEVKEPKREDLQPAKIIAPDKPYLRSTDNYALLYDDRSDDNNSNSHCNRDKFSPTNSMDSSSSMKALLKQQKTLALSTTSSSSSSKSTSTINSSATTKNSKKSKQRQRRKLALFDEAEPANVNSSSYRPFNLEKFLSEMETNSTDPTCFWSKKTEFPALDQSSSRGPKKTADAAKLFSFK